MESALHQVVRSIERSFEAGVVALGTFVDIDGAFDNTNVEAIG